VSLSTLNFLTIQMYYFGKKQSKNDKNDKIHRKFFEKCSYCGQHCFLQHLEHCKKCDFDTVQGFHVRFKLIYVKCCYGKQSIMHWNDIPPRWWQFDSGISMVQPPRRCFWTSTGNGFVELQPLPVAMLTSGFDRLPELSFLLFFYSNLSAKIQHSAQWEWHR